MTKEEMRIAHNFLSKKKEDYQPQELGLLNEYKEFAKQPLAKPKKVALLLVSVNQNYWQYAAQVVEDIQKYFLPGHQTDLFLWSDMKKFTQEEFQKKIEEVDSLESEDKVGLFFQFVEKYMKAMYLESPVDEQMVIAAMRRIGMETEFAPASQGQEVKQVVIKNITEQSVQIVKDATKRILEQYKNLQASCNIQEVEPVEWPYATLMRYSMFLQQEEVLKDYDYIMYMDVDMRIVNVVGDEILGEGLTMAEHPMYSLRREYVSPYEPNQESTAYIPRLAQVIFEEQKPRLKPLYAAGGFQGGIAPQFLEAMKVMRDNINKDFNKNYTAIWNDESHWNKYLFDYRGALVALSPSYVYPDSLIEEYYKKLWGRDYPKKIITLTKPFTLQKVDTARFQNM